MLFLQNRQAEMAKIENIHCTICTQPISSSWQNALPPAFASLEQRGLRGSFTSQGISQFTFLLGATYKAVLGALKKKKVHTCRSQAQEKKNNQICPQPATN